MLYRHHSPAARLFVVDRSPVVIEQLRRDLAGDRSIDLVGYSDGTDDWHSSLSAARPQIVLVDAGLTGIATKICASAQELRLPVVVAAGNHAFEADLAVALLDAGAIDLVARPYTRESIPALIRTCGLLSSAVPHFSSGSESSHPTDFTDGQRLIALSAGRGGVASLAETIASLPVAMPGAVALCPLPAGAIPVWIDRLNRRSSRQVSIAVDGQTIEPGQTLIAPGDRHLLVRQAGNRMVVVIQDGPAIHHARPSAELLFSSIASPHFRATSIAVLLGGAGVDGIGGLAAVRASGGKTVIESPATSRVPEASAFAERAGVADRVVPCSQIIRAVAELMSGHPSRRAA